MSKKQTFFINALILLIDQTSKIYIKTHFELGQEFKVFEWFRIYFIENEGMAWGAKLSDISSHINGFERQVVFNNFQSICSLRNWVLACIKASSKGYF